VTTSAIRPPMDRTERRAVTILLAVMALLSFWLASNLTFDPGYVQPDESFNTDFYRQQAIAMLDGRLDVPFEQFSNTECWFREGRCYGYFGLVPSAVRLGWFAVDRSTDPNPSPVIVAAGATIAVWAAIDLALGVAALRPPRQRLSPAGRLRLIVVVALLLGPGGLLTFLSQAKIYYEAIVLMIAALLVCFAFVARWIADRRTGYLVVALVAAVVATNSRPSALLPVVVLGLGVVIIALQSSSASRRRDAVVGASMATLPVASSLGVVWLKMRSFTPAFELYQNYDSELTQSYLRANGGSLQGLRFVPTMLVNYLRPDVVGWDRSWPWFRHLIPLDKDPVLVSPMTSAGLYVEFAASLTTTMPVALGCTVAFIVLAVVGMAHLTPTQWCTFGLLIVAAATVPLASLTHFALTSRYLGDFVPVLAVGTAFALVSLFGRLDRRPTAARLVTVLIAASAAITFAVNVGLHQQSFLIAG